MAAMPEKPTETTEPTGLRPGTETQQRSSAPDLQTALAGPVRSRRQKICLCMIVKDEAPVIVRCLESVRPIIDYWIIVDTGSTDGTQDLIEKYFHDVPGELHQRPWVDFAHNRSEALVLARKHGDYSLIIDADDALEFAPGFKMPYLNADSYTVEFTTRNFAIGGRRSSETPSRGVTKVFCMSSSVMWARTDSGYSLTSDLKSACQVQDSKWAKEERADWHHRRSDMRETPSFSKTLCKRRRTRFWCRDTSSILREAISIPATRKRRFRHIRNALSSAAGTRRCLSASTDPQI